MTVTPIRRQLPDAMKEDIDVKFGRGDYKVLTVFTEVTTNGEDSVRKDELTDKVRKISRAVQTITLRKVYWLRLSERRSQ
jgi:hypothetical protein